MNQEIVLNSRKFSLRGKKASDLDWYEFDVNINGTEFKNIGGADGRTTFGALIENLSKEHGQRLGDLGTAKFKDQVGGDETEYFGHFVLSSYNTFYIFRELNRLMHIVYADNEGNLLAHADVSSEVADSWLEQLRLVQDV